MSDNPAKIAELQNDKLIEVLRSKNLGIPVCRHIESKGHNGQQFVKPEYVIETFPSVEFLKSIKLLKLQIRSLVSVRKELHVETSTVPYLEINNSNASAAAAASSSPSKTITTTTTLTAEQAEKLLQEAAPLFSGGKYSAAVDLYSKVVDGISSSESDCSLKTILSRALSNRSGSFLKLNKSKEALDDAQNCVDVRPSWVRAHFRAAAAAEELEEFDVAIAAYEAAIKAEDRTGNVPSQKELESKILGVSWLKKKPKSVKHCFFSDLAVANGAAESDAKKLFSFFDTKPITQFYDLTEADIAAILGFSQHQQIKQMVEARRWLTGKYPLNFEAFAVLENNSNSNAMKQDICELIEVAQKFWHGNFIHAAGIPHMAPSTLLMATPNYRSITRDAFLFIAPHISDSISAVKFSQSLGDICSMDQSMFSSFCCEEIRDAMIAVSEYCASSIEAEQFCRVIENIIYHNESNKALFGTEAIRDAILSVSVFIDGYNGVYFCCRVIYFFHKIKPTLFCVEETVNSLVKLSKIEMKNQSPESIYWFINAVLSLLNSDKKLFNTSEIRVAVERFQEVVNDPEQVEKLKKETAALNPVRNEEYLKVIQVLCDPEKVEKLYKKTALDKLSNEEYIDKTRQLCVEIQKLFSLQSDAAASSSAAAASSSTQQHSMDVSPNFTKQEEKLVHEPVNQNSKVDASSCCCVIC